MCTALHVQPCVRGIIRWGVSGLGVERGGVEGEFLLLVIACSGEKGRLKRFEEKKKKKKRRRRGSWSKKSHIGESDLKWSRLGSMFIGLLQLLASSCCDLVFERKFIFSCRSNKQILCHAFSLNRSFLLNYFLKVFDNTQILVAEKRFCSLQPHCQMVPLNFDPLIGKGFL